MFDCYRFSRRGLPRFANAHRNDSGGTRASRPTDGFAANRLRCHFDRSEVYNPNGVEKSPTGKANVRVRLFTFRSREISPLRYRFDRDDVTIIVYALFEGGRGTPLHKVVFTSFARSGSLCYHSCHLPARSIATSPLWLKTVTYGLFLRCFAPPRRAIAIATLRLRLRSQ